MVRNIIIKKGTVRNLKEREDLMDIVGELQEKFKTDRRIKVILTEAPIRDELIGFDELTSGLAEGVEFCSILDGSSDSFVEMLLKEGGKKKLFESLDTFIKSKFVLYLSVKVDDNNLLEKNETYKLQD